MAKKKQAKTVKLKINPKYQSVVYALGFLIILLVLSQVIKFVISLTSPQTPAYAVSQRTTHPVWDGKTPVNIVLKSETVTVLNYNPTDRSLTVLSVPDETYFQLPKGYGAWPVSSIFKLGEEDQAGRGASLLKESVATLLGLPIDGFIATADTKSDLDSKELVDKLRQNPMLNLVFLHSLKTDLTPLELFQLNQQLAGLRSDKIVFLDLGTSNITESKLLPDSSRVLGVNTVSLDLFIRDKLFDQNILKESYPVAIYNATAHPGLANTAARIITNMGGNVIAISNTEQLFPESAVIAMNGDQAEITRGYSFGRYAGLFAPHCQTKACQIQDHKVEVSRAEIIIVLGEDYYNATVKQSP